MNFIFYIYHKKDYFKIDEYNPQNYKNYVLLNSRFKNKEMAERLFNGNFYKQFEELNRKLDTANETISKLLLNNSILSTEIKELNIKLDEANKKNQELLLEIERLKK